MPRVLTARFMHETNTFSRVKTDLAVWLRRDFHRDNEIPAAFRGTRSALGASFEAADKYGWTLIHPISANANPSGTVTDVAFEHIGGAILGAARAAPVDGALLHLHGAMVVESHEDGEGELLRRLRQSPWPEVPVVVTLDLHANVTQAMADNASALIAFRSYPHIDMYERAWQGAELLERAMKGEVRPKTVIATRPMLYGLDWGRTQRGPDGGIDRLRRGPRGRRHRARGQHLCRVSARRYPRCRPDRDHNRRRRRPQRPGDRRRVHGPCLGHA